MNHQGAMLDQPLTVGLAGPAPDFRALGGFHGARFKDVGGGDGGETGRVLRLAGQLHHPPIEDGAWDFGKKVPGAAQRLGE